jgi:hypothetical protein
MIKHVGKHNQRKIAIVYRKVTDEGHMALVMYTDNLPMMVHDEAMKVLESEVGQNAKELADALFRHIMPDGTNCLQHIHKAGYLKKVPCNQVIVTPTAKSTVRLDELNDILDKLEAGGEAAQRLDDIDKNRGIKGVKQQGRELGMPAEPFTGTPTTSADVAGVLSDAEIAQQRIGQATRMEAEAKGLLAEAKRLKAEAASLKPVAVKKATPAKAKTTTPKATDGRATKTKKATA